AAALAKDPLPINADAARAISLTSFFTGRARFVLLLGFVSGFVFFAFEVLSVHLIGAVVGSSAYAFADMLAAILVGMLVAGVITSTMSRRQSIINNEALALVFAVGALMIC